MNYSISAFFIVCPLVFLASLVDAIAGGGGLISLPAYILTGIPVHNAVATNKLSSAIGTVFSTVRYCKNKYIILNLAIPGVLLALVGSAIGANLVLLVSAKILEVMLIVILPVAAIYMMLKKDIGQETKGEISKEKQMVIVCIASFLLGMYDGFYGPGVGTFLILIYTGWAKLDIRSASGNVKLVNLASNIAALVTFLIHGKVFMLLGLVAAIFSVAGHMVGSGLVIKNGMKIVRPIMIVVLILLFMKVISGI